MNECPKCLCTDICGPFYGRDFFGREHLEFYCRQCGYREKRPTADQGNAGQKKSLKDTKG